MPSLEKLCLDLIIQQFETFYYAFTISKNKNLQRHLEFLQRRFSVQLATELHKNKKIKEAYFEFLMNEHLNYLDGKWFKESSYLNCMEDIFRRTPNLTRISFTACNDEILEYIAKYCPKIVEIDVRHSNITDEGIKYLCTSTNGKVPCPDLKNLFVWPSNVTGKGTGCLLRKLPSLQKIDYNVPLLLHDLHKENLARLENVDCYSLVELNLLRFKNFPIYPDILKACLTVCPKLESFSCYISNKEQLNFFTNSHLKKLHLQFPPSYPNINIDNFLKTYGCNLTYLKVSDCSMSIAVAAECCPVLKEFFAHRVNFTDEDDNSKSIFPSLTECSFSHIDPSSGRAVSLFLLTAPLLKSVSFIYCTLSREVQRQILIWCKNPSARKIDFWCLDLEIEFLKDILLRCPTLQDMTLTECSVDVQDTKESLQNLAKSLPNKPRILFFQMFSYGQM